MSHSDKRFSHQVPGMDLRLRLQVSVPIQDRPDQLVSDKQFRRWQNHLHPFQMHHLPLQYNYPQDNSNYLQLLSHSQ